jgi:organic radical activating enzyme
VCSSATQLVVITGGEPLLQQENLLPLVGQLAADGRRVEIETNGTVVPRPELVAVTDRFLVSPKLARFAGAAPLSQRINPSALTALAASGRAAFLFVITDQAEVDEVGGLQHQFGFDPLWVMPAGSTTADVLPRLAWLSEAALARGWHLSARLHVLARG